MMLMILWREGQREPGMYVEAKTRDVYEVKTVVFVIMVAYNRVREDWEEGLGAIDHASSNLLRRPSSVVNEVVPIIFNLLLVEGCLLRVRLIPGPINVIKVRSGWVELDEIIRAVECVWVRPSLLIVRALNGVHQRHAIS
mgnify:CR=1 FL=1